MAERQSNRICRHYHVFGRVQGVWYRGSAREQAQQLGLSGWVRNCEDGSVEAVACGAPESLEAFESWLRQGPSAARVDRVKESTASAEPPEGDFRIRY